MKSLIELRIPRVAIAAVAAAGLSASLGSGVAAAKGKPDVAIERKAAASGKASASGKADERRPINRGAGRKVG